MSSIKKNHKTNNSVEKEISRDYKQHELNARHPHGLLMTIKRYK
jgi:hypothetical protein